MAVSMLLHFWLWDRPELVVKIVEGVAWKDSRGVSALNSKGLARSLNGCSPGCVIVAGDEDAFDAWGQDHVGHVAGAQRHPDRRGRQQLVDGEPVFGAFADDDLARFRPQANGAAPDLSQALLWRADLGELPVRSKQRLVDA